MVEASAMPAAPKRPRSKRTWLIVVLILAALGGAGYYYLMPAATDPQTASETPAPPAVTSARRVSALGEVLPGSDRVTVAAPTGQDTGRIANILIEEGATVTRGQVLAVLDTEAVQKAVLQQAIANETLKRVALAAKAADLESSEGQLSAQVNQQNVALEKAQLELDRMTRLRDTGLYEDAALIDKRLDVESARFNLRNTELQLERNRLLYEGGRRLDEASARAELDASTAARVKAEADYAKTSILAPINGRILALFGRLGEQIGSDGFAEIGDTRTMKVRAEVYESDISAISVGQPVTVTSRALQTQLAGTVSRIGVRISDQSILSTDPAAIVDARVIEVWVALDAASSKATEAMSGLQVLVTFSTSGGDHD
jgi:HlyD family secretion protein